MPTHIEMDSTPGPVMFGDMSQRPEAVTTQITAEDVLSGTVDAVAEHRKQLAATIALVYCLGSHFLAPGASADTGNQTGEGSSLGKFIDDFLTPENIYTTLFVTTFLRQAITIKARQNDINTFRLVDDALDRTCEIATALPTAAIVFFPDKHSFDMWGKIAIWGPSLFNASLDAFAMFTIDVNRVTRLLAGPLSHRLNRVA